MNRTLEELIAAQHGVIKHAQALEAGMTKHELAARVNSRNKKKKWLRLFHGVHLTTPASPQFEQWCQAALLRSGESSLLWGRTAARLHELDGFTLPPNKRTTDPGLPICVAAPHSVGQSEKINHTKLSIIDPIDVAFVGNLRCASVVRTVIEVVERCSWRTMVMVFEDLHRRGLHPALARRMEELSPYRPWLFRLKKFMERRGPDAVATESPAEAICDDVLWRMGLVAERQFPVRCGRSIKRLDLAFPKYRVAIECDGRQFHGEDRFEADAERSTEITAVGWSTLRFTWSALKNEVFVRSKVREALQNRGWNPQA